MKFDYDPNSMDRCGVPVHLQTGLRAFIEHGQRNGSGLTSILCNKPVLIVVRMCDPQTWAGIQNIANFMHSYAPAACFGSTDAVEAWIALGGIQGQGGTW